MDERAEELAELSEDSLEMMHMAIKLLRKATINTEDQEDVDFLLEAYDDYMCSWDME